MLKKSGYADRSDHLSHLSYGIAEFPEGKMKSREGTVVDADDLIADMRGTAREMSTEMGKPDGCTDAEADAVSAMVGLEALKYFILKVDPKKTMLFDPRESIDFNGNTGLYTHARIRSILRKAAEAGVAFDGAAAAAAYLPEEIEPVKSLTEYLAVVKSAGEHFAPSIIGAYVYELPPPKALQPTAPTAPPARSIQPLLSYPTRSNPIYPVRPRQPGKPITPVQPDGSLNPTAQVAPAISTAPSARSIQPAPVLSNPVKPIQRCPTLFNSVQPGGSLNPTAAPGNKPRPVSDLRRRKRNRQEPAPRPTGRNASKNPVFF